MQALKAYGWNLLVALDNFANVLLSPLLNLLLRPKAARFGDPDETLSSVFGKNVRAGKCYGCRLVCRLLNKIDPGHCQASIEDDEGSKAL